MTTGYPPVSEALKRLRKERGLTQQSLADLSGVHRVTIARLESGAHRGMDLATARQLAPRLGVAVSELIEGYALGDATQPWVVEFLESDWPRTLSLTTEEEDWLRRLPLHFTDTPLEPESTAKLVLWRRETEKH